MLCSNCFVQHTSCYFTTDRIHSNDQLLPSCLTATRFSPKIKLKSKPTYHSHCALQVYRISETKVGTDLKNPLPRVYIVGRKSATIPTRWRPSERRVVRVRREGSSVWRDPPSRAEKKSLNYYEETFAFTTLDDVDTVGCQSSSTQPANPSTHQHQLIENKTADGAETCQLAQDENRTSRQLGRDTRTHNETPTADAGFGPQQ